MPKYITCHLHQSFKTKLFCFPVHQTAWNRTPEQKSNHQHPSSTPSNKSLREEPKLSKKDGVVFQNVFSLRWTVYLKVLVFPSRDTYVNLYFNFQIWWYCWLGKVQLWFGEFVRTLCGLDREHEKGYSMLACFLCMRERIKLNEWNICMPACALVFVKMYRFQTMKQPLYLGFKTVCCIGWNLGGKHGIFWSVKFNSIQAPFHS